MLVLRFSTNYNLDSDSDVRAGTIGLRFSAAGPAEYTTKTDGGAALDNVLCNVVAGQEIETGPLLSVGTVPDGTVGLVGR